MTGFTDQTGTDSRRFTEAFIDDVRSRTGLVDLVSRDVALKRAGREFTGLCPFHKEKTPSFTVNEDKGFFHCFGCGEHGGAFDWIMNRHGFTFVEAVEELAIRAGLQPDHDGRRPLRPAPVIERANRDDDRAARAQKIATARHRWSECVAAQGTLVETYLGSRGITCALPPTIRFHPNLYNTETARRMPAMVACVQGADGKISGIHRTWLKADGSGKADIRKNKKMMGDCWTGAIRLMAANPRLCIAEGIETAYSVHVATGQAVWSAGSMGNMAALILPPIVRDIVLCIDADSAPDAMAKTIDKAKIFHSARDCRVHVARPAPGMDFNDMLMATLADGSIAMGELLNAKTNR